MTTTINATDLASTRPTILLLRAVRFGRVLSTGNTYPEGTQVPATLLHGGTRDAVWLAEFPGGESAHIETRDAQRVY